MAQLAVAAFAGINWASVGISVGLGLIQRSLIPDTVTQRQGQRLSQSQIMSSAEGSPVNVIAGTRRLSGQVIWATKFKEEIVTEVTSQGGKGGPKAITESTSYVYTTSFAVGICEAEGDVSLRTVWADGQALDLNDIVYRWYDGSQDMADPKIQAVEGVDRTPAFKGVAYLVLEDLDLGPFGNRLPQISVEVARNVRFDDDAVLENAVRAVNIIPGAGEFVYGTQKYFTSDGDGNSAPENTNSNTNVTDFVTSLDHLESQLPNVTSTSLVVTWFASSTDASTLTLKPKVDSKGKDVLPSAWHVSDQTRTSADLITQVDGSPAFGGTPSDATVREAVAEMKARGLRVMFYPFVIVDDGDQYPWRGEITGDASTYIGTVAASNYGTWNGTNLPYSGPSQWSHSRMILHYAALLSDLLDSGDAFLVGSEMVGMSAESDWGTGLADLMDEARVLLPAGVLVSYAANWDEYDASSLANAWANADFIGIDYYMPLTDWRSDDDEVYRRDLFAAGAASGEYWDYYYATDADRLAGNSSPITSDEFRQKNIGYWRDQNHAGVDIWLTEFGCPAVDKGANEPNVFPDWKSSVPDLPNFSDGTRNDAVQRLYVEGLISHFTSTGAVDPQNMFVWAWDARPFPSFPALKSVWADAPSWDTGHWLNGRVGSVSIADAIRDRATRIGLTEDQIDTSALEGIATRVRGYATGDVASPTEALQNLMTTYMVDAVETGTVVKFFPKSGSNLVTVELDDFVVSDEAAGATYSVTRVRDINLPARYDVNFADAARNYAAASVPSTQVSGASENVKSFTSIAQLDESYAATLADVLLHEEWIARDTVSFEVPFGGPLSEVPYISYAPGDYFPFRGRSYRITQMTIGDSIEIEAVGFRPEIYSVRDYSVSAYTVSQVSQIGSSLVWFAELPLRSPDDPAPWSPRVVGRQLPWPGQITTYREDGSGGYTLTSTLLLPSKLARTTSPLGAGPLWVWDRASTVTVRMLDTSDNVTSFSEESVLNGANTIAIETVEGGEWEILQFANSTLNGDGTFTLSDMLRGQLGTDAHMVEEIPANARVIFLQEGTIGNLSGTSTNLGVDIPLRYGPSGVDIADARFQDVTVTPRGVAYRPYAPVHLRQTNDGGDITFSWTRRTRFDGDSWDVSEVPLNEDFERYEIDILDGSSVVRTLVVDNVTSAVYSAAEQSDDFGAPQDTVSWRVHQMSAVFGRGSPANG